MLFHRHFCPDMRPQYRMDDPDSYLLFRRDVSRDGGLYRPA